MRINFDLADLAAFTAVAKDRSFHLAASSLNISPSALSRRIQKLEDLVGVRLLERTTRSVALTPVGKEFLVRALEIQTQLEQVVLALQGQQQHATTAVTIASVPSATHYFLLPMIEQFGRTYPTTKVRILDLSANDVLEAVQRNEADFGINFVGLQEPGLEFHPLLEDEFVLAAHRNHPLARRKSLRWRDVDGHKFIAVWKGSGNRLLMDFELAKAGLSLGWFFETRHVTTALAMVEAGIGIAALPRSALPGRDHPTVTGIPLSEPRISRMLGAVRRRDRPMSATARSFWDGLLSTWRKPPRAEARTAARAEG